MKLSIVPKHVVDAVGKDAFNLKPVGSGPYKFDGWQRGVQVTLTANDKYWGTKGRSPRVAFRAVPDAATRVANLQAGTSDLAVTLDSDLAAQLKNSPKAKVLSVLTERVAYLAMNIQKPPVERSEGARGDRLCASTSRRTGRRHPRRLRQAGPGACSRQPMSAGSRGSRLGAIDLAKAKALITEAGSKAKQPISLLTAPVYDQRVVQAIQQMLIEAGLDGEDRDDRHGQLAQADAERAGVRSRR